MKYSSAKYSKLFLQLLGLTSIIFSTSLTFAQTTTTLIGSGTFTVPCGVTSLTVEVWGAGGGSPGDATNNATAGSGGGSGGYVTSTIVVAPGGTYAYAIGAGGAAGGGNGGPSNFGIVNANGGGGGNGEGGAAGLGANPGGSGGTVTNGVNGGTNSGTTGGSGGAAPNGGAGGVGSTNGGQGTVGGFPGGGAGASGNRSGGSEFGRAGGAGSIDVTYTPGCPSPCTSNASTTSYSYISNVTMGAVINNSTSGCSNYSDNTASCATVDVGSTYNLCITKTNDCTGGTQYTGRFAAWIDWNGDGDFNDAGEQVITDGAASHGPVCANVTVPAGAVPGNTIMRCVFREGATAPPNCGSYTSWGETEDYCLLINNGPTCSDGIMNQDETGVDCGGATCPPCHCVDLVLSGDETGIDCGGSCDVCGTCSDGIMNQDETAIDCGGVCPVSCTPQVTGTTSDDCTAGSTNTVHEVVCDQIGTSAYNLMSPDVDFNSSGGATTPTPAPPSVAPCAPVGGTGTWSHVDLDPGITQIQMQFTGGSVGAGSSTTYAAAYQGTCGSLSYVTGSCQPALDFISGSYGAYNVVISGLNSAEDLWIFMFNDGGKAFNVNYDLVGTGTPPSNTTCATADGAAGTGCNLGAAGSTDLITPGANGIACTGGNWGSNENTTFYSFTPTATTGDLVIDNIVCNDGTAGALQFGVWETCPLMETNYNGDPGFLGCIVGTSTLSLTGLTVGQTYYIGTDGFAGDNCAWSFTGNNLVLPIDLVKFTGNYAGKQVDLSWLTATETNNNFFTLERSADGDIYEVVARIDAAGSTVQLQEYRFTDPSPFEGISYYRLSQTDYDGTVKQCGVVAVRGKFLVENISVQPNPLNGTGNLVFNSGTRGLYSLLVYDLTGRVMFSKELEVQEGKNTSRLDLEHLPNGMYFISLGKDEYYRNIRFIKE
ncbi:MAG: hypothetical protein ACI9J3_002055 [Parvicellaceae bacterium]|jgi:hypothetical protein